MKSWKAGNSEANLVCFQSVSDGRQNGFMLGSCWDSCCDMFSHWCLRCSWQSLRGVRANSKSLNCVIGLEFDRNNSISLICCGFCMSLNCVELNK